MSSLSTEQVIVEKIVLFSCRNIIDAVARAARVCSNWNTVVIRGSWSEFWRRQVGADPDVAERLCLHTLRKQCAVELAVILFQNGVSVHCQERRTEATPLHLASRLCAISGNIDLMRFLHFRGANVRIRDGKGRTCLHYAAHYTSAAAAQFLLERGAAVDAVDDEKGMTPLMCSAAEGHSAVARVLIEHGADLKKTTPDGWSARSFADHHSRILVLGVLNEAERREQQVASSPSSSAAAVSASVNDNDSGNNNDDHNKPQPQRVCPELGAEAASSSAATSANFVPSFSPQCSAGGDATGAGMPHVVSLESVKMCSMIL